MVQRPDSPRVSTTDFYQTGVSLNLNRFSLSSDLFLIDRSNEQVYIPDDGSYEFRGPSRAYGFEAKTSVQLTRHVSLNGGLTKVMNAFYRSTFPRVYVDSAPHAVANAALSLAGWRGFSGSLRFRYINSYRLDGEDPSIRASGLTVLDFSMVKPIRRWVDFNFSVDNLTDKVYLRNAELLRIQEPARSSGPEPHSCHSRLPHRNDRGVDLPFVRQIAEPSC